MVVLERDGRQLLGWVSLSPSWWVESGGGVSATYGGDIGSSDVSGLLVLADTDDTGMIFLLVGLTGQIVLGF